MEGCYIGRGALLVSVLGSGEGFFSLSGQSEVTLIFEEDNESINDARHGVNERVDWYVRNYRVRLEADCFDINPDAILNLMKTVYTPVGADTNSTVELPDGIKLGNRYFLGAPGVLNVSVVDDAAAPVSSANYTVDEAYGFITFNSLGGGLEPFTVEYDNAAFSTYALSTRSPIVMEAMFKGFNKINDKEVQAHFYRLTLDIGEQLKLVQKDFSSIQVRLQATPDVAQTLDPTLGQYGRIMFT